MPNVSEQARKTAAFSRDAVSEAGNQAAQSVQSALREGALATVGAGDQLVRQLRTLSDRLRHLDLRTDQGRQELEERLSHLRENATTEFEQLVARGREVVEGLGQSDAAERAWEQSSVATSQVKAAVTSLRKIADVAAKQAAQTASDVRETAGQRADETAKQADVAASQAKAAATSIGKAAEETADVLADAADRIGTESTDVPLEDLKVVELRELAKQRGIEGRTGMNKAELVRALRNA